MKAHVRRRSTCHRPGLARSRKGNRKSSSLARAERPMCRSAWEELIPASSSRFQQHIQGHWHVTKVSTLSLIANLQQELTVIVNFSMLLRRSITGNINASALRRLSFGRCGGLIERFIDFLPPAHHIRVDLTLFLSCSFTSEPSGRQSFSYSLSCVRSHIAQATTAHSNATYRLVIARRACAQQERVAK